MAEAIHLFRKFLNNGYLSFRNERRKLSKFEAWIDLLDKADTDGKIYCSLGEMKKAWKWPHTVQVFRFMKELIDNKYVWQKNNVYIIKGYKQWYGAEPPHNYLDITTEIVKYFNFLRKRTIGVDDARVTMIAARMQDFKNRIDLEDLKMVVKYKHEEWKDDKKMSKFLEFETLFRKSNFKKYYEKAKDEKRKASSFFETRVTHQ